MLMFLFIHKQVDDETVTELLDMKRPFKPLKELDLKQVASDISERASPKNEKEKKRAEDPWEKAESADAGDKDEERASDSEQKQQTKKRSAQEFSSKEHNAADESYNLQQRKLRRRH
jgi:hypothetical protein